MIEPRPGHRGVIGEQHGLQRLQDTLTALSQGQAAQQTRDSQMQTQLTTQATTLAYLVRWVRWQRWALGVLLALMLGVGGLVGWQLWHPPQREYARALGAIDGTIMQTWGACPRRCKSP